jgi:hypothetical protein
MMIQNDTLSINHQGKPVAGGQNLMKRRRNMIKTIGFRPEGRNPNKPSKFVMLVASSVILNGNLMCRWTSAFCARGLGEITGNPLQLSASGLAIFQVQA